VHSSKPFLRKASAATDGGCCLQQALTAPADRNLTFRRAPHGMKKWRRSRSAKHDALRLDKYMKVSRLAKRRTEAKDGIEAGRITKDGRALKPGYEVKPGDVLVIHYRTKFLTVRVVSVPERVLPSLKPADLYEIVDERRDDPVDWLG
jgi:ribosomal 50S subunit-recycling heat shock protein